MSKHRVCYNCAHYEDKSESGIYAAVFSPRCLKGLNPSLEQLAQPGMQSQREQGAFEPDAMAAFCDSYLWAPPVTGDKFRMMARKKVREDSRFSTVNLSLKFVKFWEKGTSVRLKVERGTNSIYTETGYVAMSTGLQPVFILVRSINAKSSSVILSDEDRIVGIKDWKAGGKYRKYQDLG